jgi:hypothetical protein
LAHVAGPIYLPAPKYVVTISRSIQSDDERIQPQRSRSSQRTHKDFLSGTFDPLSIIKVNDNPLTAAGPLVGCLGKGGLPTRAGPRTGSGARQRSLVCGRRRPEEQYFCWTGLLLVLRLRLLLAAVYPSDDERIQPQSSQRTHRVFL